MKSDSTAGDASEAGDSLSIDRLIDWLSKVRESEPTRPLAEILREQFCQTDQLPETLLSKDDLIDLVCIDLITQHRSGNSATVESYVQQFDCLNSDEIKLDLIDAELCVRHEVSTAWDADAVMAEFCGRFPDQKREIVELIQLQSTPLPARSENPITDSFRANSQPEKAIRSDNDASLEFSVGDALAPVASSNQANVPMEDSLPISPPRWFVGSEIVASSQGPSGSFGRWLIRGRDSTSGKPLLMKIIALGPQTSNQLGDKILDSCERAAKVTSPSWVPPIIAAIEKQHLAVIRRWEYGNVWNSIADPSQLPQRLRLLAGVAYGLQAAHNRGAFHGGIHANNILIDHHGKPALVDGSFSIRGIQSLLQQDSTPTWRRDAKDLLKLVSAETIDAPGNWCRHLGSTLQDLVASHEAECCGMIGDQLIRRADQATADTGSSSCSLGSSSRGLGSSSCGLGSWRQRLATWLSKE